MPSCYYYDEQRNRCNCHDDENLNDLLDENIKLRELVRILYFCHQEGTECDECAMNGAEMSVRLDELVFCDGVNESMRDLGIEVG